MNEDANNMTCAEFQAHLPELIGTGEDISSHPHLETCELCRELLSELETIAEAARQLFPVADPPDALWDHIKAAIESDSESAPSEESDPVLTEAKQSATESIETSGSGLAVEPA
jgi:hypothetical protein